MRSGIGLTLIVIADEEIVFCVKKMLVRIENLSAKN